MVVEIDVAEQDSIEKAVQAVADDLEANDIRKPLHALVNNAGVIAMNDMKTCLDVNVYGALHVTNAFVPLLNQTEGRVINVSSRAGPNFVAECNEQTQKFFTNPEAAWEDFEQLLQQVLKQYNPKTKAPCPAIEVMGIHRKFLYIERALMCYAFSKACLNLLTMIQAKQYPNLKINSCYPGAIITDMTRRLNDGNMEQMKAKGLKEVTHGTTAIMKLLTCQELEGNGHFYWEDGSVGPLIQKVNEKHGIPPP